MQQQLAWFCKIKNYDQTVCGTARKFSANSHTVNPQSLETMPQKF